MPYEPINRIAQWAIVALLVVGGFVVGARWAANNGSEQPSGPVVMGHVAGTEAALLKGAAPAAATLSASPVANPDASTTTTTLPGNGAPKVSFPAVVRQVTTTSTTAPPTTTTAPKPTTTTNAPKPTTTTTPPTTTTVPETTTTTVPVPSTTTTSTTTTSTTTTSTTTTTTTVAETPGLFLERVSAVVVGDRDEWRVRLEIDLGATTGGSKRAQVSIAWDGDRAGTGALATNRNGRGRVTLGPFADDSVTVAIVDVQGEGWVYRPELNLAGATLTVAAPDDDDD